MPQQLEGFLRLRDILGNRDKGITPILPISASSWWNGIRSGKYPTPVKLGPRTTAWKVSDVRALLARMGAEGAQ